MIKLNNMKLLSIRKTKNLLLFKIMRNKLKNQNGQRIQKKCIYNGPEYKT